MPDRPPPNLSFVACRLVRVTAIPASTQVTAQAHRSDRSSRRHVRPNPVVVSRHPEPRPWRRRRLRPWPPPDRRRTRRSIGRPLPPAFPSARRPLWRLRTRECRCVPVPHRRVDRRPNRPPRRCATALSHRLDASGRRTRHRRVMARRRSIDEWPVRSARVDRFAAPWRPRHAWLVRARASPTYRLRRSSCHLRPTERVPRHLPTRHSRRVPTPEPPRP